MRSSDLFVMASAHFENLLRNEDKSPVLAAIETLFNVLKKSKASTVAGLTEDLNEGVRSMQATDQSSVCIASASELFMRFISLTALDHSNFPELKATLESRGQQFINRVSDSRYKICTFSIPFFRDRCRILTHSYSRVVCQAMIAAHSAGSRFQVYVTQSLPDNSGLKMKEKLKAAGIHCVSIVDGAAGYLMESIDFVLLGAEGVMETGGIINKIGSYGISVCARAVNVPVYVMAESMKFVKEFPLSQADIPSHFKYNSSTLDNGICLDEEHPLVDYTPPAYIDLLFTDLGILTPAAVSDELIKLYL